jgi:hypothetical protein
VVEQNTATALSLEESKLGAVCPFKASSLKYNLSNKNYDKELPILAFKKSV